MKWWFQGWFSIKVGIEQRTKENELVGMDLETELSLYANKKEINLFRSAYTFIIDY